MRVNFSSSNTQEWEDAVHLVKDKDRRSFNASTNPKPTCFTVDLLTNKQEQEYVVACSGLTVTASRTLFSKQYLPEPIEHRLFKAEYINVNKDYNHVFA